MQVGAAQYQMAGGIHRIPVPEATGHLHATAFAVTGPDPAAALEDVGAEVMVCLLTDAEIAMRFPDYPAWMADPAPPTRPSTCRWSIKESPATTLFGIWWMPSTSTLTRAEG